jgi:phage portal protein BeeE
VLRQTGGEPLSGQELADLAASFNHARETNQTAALNEFVTYTETLTSPDKMLLIDSSEYQSKEMARLCNIPSYLAGIAVGGYSYVSNQGAFGLVVVWCETIRGLHRVNTLTKQRST